MEFTPTLVENLERLGAWGILTTDNNLMIVGWNRWLERHTGRPASQTIGRPLLEVYPDLEVRNLVRYFHDALQGQANILSQRFHKYLLPMPPTVPVTHLMHMQQTVRISPMYEGGEIRGTLTLIEDVTERVVTESELRQQAERLEEANRQKDDFLAMLAHELRNPLAPIRNGIQVLNLIGSDEAVARDTREMIERQVAHMVRLVDDLLDVSRIVRGKVHLHVESCDLFALVRQVGRDYKSILADGGVDLIVTLPNEPCWIRGDAIRLSQIVSNLLQNASKFTNRGGLVRLSAEFDSANQRVTIKVGDTGIGMSSETVAKVFDAFSQAEISLARSKGGLGLGLALVKGLTELHGGNVEAYSAGVGHGSEFTVHIPYVPTEPPPPPDTSPPEVSELRRAQKVLLIEDNRDAAHSLKTLITHMGFDVEVAFTGPDGLEKALQSSPDIVLCDIGLPGLDGFAIARALRAEPGTQDAFLVAQSGYGQSEDIRKAMEAGFDVHLIKPVDIAELEQTLKFTHRRSSNPVESR